MIAHIVTTLALATSDDTHLVDARDLLTASIDQLSTSTTRTRALALTQARLAVLHQHTGDRDRADHWLAPTPPTCAPPA
jgi:hypothetical protein